MLGMGISINCHLSHSGPGWLIKLLVGIRHRPAQTPPHHQGSSLKHPLVGVNDTPVFLLNEYIVELNPANFNILNQILN